MPEAIIHLQYPLTGMDKEAVNAVYTATDNTAIFERLFRENFERLHSYACTITKDEAAAEEIVQQVFYKLWEGKDKVELGGDATAYLYKAVYSQSLNFLKHNKVKKNYKAYFFDTNKEADQNADPAVLNELREKIDIALNELPKQCRTVFQMSRFEELKYKEIADKLGVSVKTVENQVCKALRLLRKKLADYLPLLCMLFINVKK